mgnify:CR=1 FL=1
MLFRSRSELGAAYAKGDIRDQLFFARAIKKVLSSHSKEHQHALKEVDAAALAVVENPDQVVQILKYVLDGRV